MDFDTGWKALFRPGWATSYFSPPASAPPRPSGSYGQATAWWLAELSRLAYRRQGRDDHLRAVGLEESHSFQFRGTQASLITAAEPVETSPRFLVFRGTDGPRDWWWNLNVSCDRSAIGGRVHRGFNRALDQIWGPIAEVLGRISGPLAYAGHSLGGALAVMAAARRPPTAVYTFGAPRVGDQAFAEALERVPIFQVVDNDDVVPRLPPALESWPCRHPGGIYRIVSRSRGSTRDWRGPERTTELPTPFDGRPRVLGPPRLLSDHSPVNYVAHLERLQTTTGGSAG